MKRVLFHRQFTGYYGGTSGGQIKVRDCFEHILASEGFIPKVYFNPKTLWFDNPGNVWSSYRNTKHEVKVWDILTDDLLFFAGSDWNILNENERNNPPVPIINIVHPRHCRNTDIRKDFLKYPAIRITKSSLSKKIIEEHGVNGPLFVIPDALDPKDLPPINQSPDFDILIVGLKNPGMAKQIYRRLKWRNFFKRRKLKIALQTPPKLPTRRDFLDLLNNSKMVVYLPLEEKYGHEGFYLPALEGMFLKKLVICPNVTGNVDFCISNKTCLMPEYTTESILDKVDIALSMSSQEFDKIINQAYQITKNHHLSLEQEKLIELLKEVDFIWSQKDLFSEQKNK